jgi:DNA-directed RNA polymerase subunit RPC12/RpoP
MSTGRGCAARARKRLTCRVCGREFSYRDIVDDLPIVQCPTCEGRAVEVSDG